MRAHNRTGYNRGCRCERCMDATRRSMQNWRGSEQAVPCWFCSRSFKNEKGRNVHMTRVHEREGGME